MAAGKNKTARRREVRRNIPKPAGGWRALLRRRETLWAAVYVIAFTAIGGVLAVYSSTLPQYQLGQMVSVPVVSRVDFRAVNKQKTSQQRQQIESRTPRVYAPNQAYIEFLQSRFAKLVALAKGDNQNSPQPDLFNKLDLTSAALAQLHKQIVNGKPTDSWINLKNNFIADLLNLAVLSPAQYNQEIKRGLHSIILRIPDPTDASKASEHIRYNNVWIRSDDTKALRDKIESFVTPFPPELRRTIVAMVTVKPQPTYLYSASFSQKKKQQRASQVAPVTESFAANEVLVPAGSQINASDLHLIQSENQAFQLKKSATAFWLGYAGIIALVLFIVLGLWAYIVAYNQRILRNPMRGLAITALMLAALAVAIFLVQVNLSSLYAAAIAPTVLITMVMAISYNQRFALAVGVIQTFLITTILGLSIGFCLASIAGVVVAAALLKDVRTRSKLVIVGCWSGLAMALVAFVSELATGHLYIAGELQRIVFQDCVWAFVAGAGIGALTQAILPGIERVFKVTTAMTLRELNDASHPLLQRLAQEAPGTYQHSLRIADMAEAGAEAIGADGLLCRVGAMYHDIGKINKPMYFIENQGGGPNRHGKLSPAMSLLVIVGHVKDGIEMAREYGIPPVLRSFIASHHGTTLVEYFYHAAKKQKQAKDNGAPSEFEFRYPGPKPGTRETAILLLCDGIEGAARALPEPTPVRLEQVVRNMANKRLMDGQFDECGLTLKELAQVESAVIKTLCAVYHGRIKYPDAKGDQGGSGVHQSNNSEYAGPHSHTASQKSMTA